VLAAEAAAPRAAKSIDFVIASNLALLTDDILAFCKSHGILLSTSLDGPPDLHNKNRPRPGGNSYELAVRGIRRSQEILGPDRVGALMTTTEASLDRVKDIVDEYVSLGLDGIFLRPLSPYGFAVKKRLQEFTRRPTLGQPTDEEVKMISIARMVRKKRGSWWQLPKDFKERPIGD
jgi:uncharacterized protein